MHLCVNVRNVYARGSNACVVGGRLCRRLRSEYATTVRQFVPLRGNTQFRHTYRVNKSKALSRSGRGNGLFFSSKRPPFFKKEGLDLFTLCDPVWFEDSHINLGGQQQKKRCAPSQPRPRTRSLSGQPRLSRQPRRSTRIQLITGNFRVGDVSWHGWLHRHASVRCPLHSSYARLAIYADPLTERAPCRQWLPLLPPPPYPLVPSRVEFARCRLRWSILMQTGLCHSRHGLCSRHPLVMTMQSIQCRLRSQSHMRLRPYPLRRSPMNGRTSGPHRSWCHTSGVMDGQSSPASHTKLDLCGLGQRRCISLPAHTGEMMIGSVREC